jgi:hypothetical protein
MKKSFSLTAEEYGNGQRAFVVYFVCTPLPPFVKAVFVKCKPPAAEDKAGG